MVCGDAVRMLDSPPRPAPNPSEAIRSCARTSWIRISRERVRGRPGLVADWVAEALPWGFDLADIRVHVDLWVGGLDPGRATLDAPELERRIPSCAVHLDAAAGHWLLISHWSEIVTHALS